MWGWQVAKPSWICNLGSGENKGERVRDTREVNQAATSQHDTEEVGK